MMHPCFPWSVLVLHNAPDPAAEAGGYGVSDRGVLEQVAAVADAIEQLGAPVRKAAVARLDDVPIAIAAGAEPIVFNLVEALRSGVEDAAWIPALCRAQGRACTGGDSRSLFLTQNKDLARQRLAQNGVPTPSAICLAPGQSLPAVWPPLPLIVKPVCADASEGIDAAAVVTGPGPALQRAIERVHRQFAQAALVEQFIDGREFNVAVLRCENGAQALPVAEILFENFPADRPRIVDYDAKWNESSFSFQHTPRRIPAQLDETVAAALQRMALAAWHAAGGADFLRVDLRMDRCANAYVLEVNVNPDLSPGAGFAAALAAADIPFVEFIRRTLAFAAGRQGLCAHTEADAPYAVPHCGLATIRRAETADNERLLELLRETRFFRPGELAVAAEVIEDAAQEGPAGHYQSWVAILGDGRLAGWVCYGPTPCTEGTWDIYWLAVDTREQGRGLGRALMRFAEERIGAQGGRLCVAETGGSLTYAPTRRFYERIGYCLSARLPDFYAPGDDKVMYTRAIDECREHEYGKKPTS